MKILNILSSINGENSQTNRLVHAINEQLLAAHPEATIVERDLSHRPLPHLDSSRFLAFSSSPDALSHEARALLAQSDEAVKELEEADSIVIAVPFYNFTIPGTLKSWIDHIVRRGVTFAYTPDGPKGLLSGKKVYLAMASGGVYSQGPMTGYDFAEPYLRTVLGFLGLTDVTTFRAEGINVPGLMEAAVPKAIEAVMEHDF